MKHRLGILTVNKDNELKGNRRNFRDIIRLGRKMGFDVVVVTPESFQATGESIFAWEWDGKWEKKFSRYPDVIYNRIPDRKTEQMVAVKETKKLLKRLEIPYFNPGFFNKKKIYQCLSQQKDTSLYVPHTIPLTSKNQLTSLLSNTSCIYLKPIHGSLGIGIIRITKEGDTYHSVFQKKGKRIDYQCKNVDHLLHQVTLNIGNHEYVAQEGIDLARIGERAFDLRLLLQKGREGFFKLVGLGCRVAAPDAITTHVPNGGVIRNVNEVLQQVFPGHEREIADQVKNIALQCAETIEEGVDGLIGEMSMDIGVDRHMRPWFFEANAKPMKFDEPDIRERSLKGIFYFCEFLLGKTSRHR